MTTPQLSQTAETTFRYYINKKKPYPYFEGHLKKYRCPHIKLNGQRCNRQSVIGFEECRQHLKMDQHLSIKKSHIPKAGLGVFATNGSNNDDDVVFQAGNKVCDYNGEDIDAHTLYERYLQNTAPYAIEVKNNLYIDGALVRGIGSMINAAKSQDEANTEFVRKAGNRVEIHAKENIKNGDELTAWYGSSYRLTGEPIHHSTRLYNKKTSRSSSSSARNSSQPTTKLSSTPPAVAPTTKKFKLPWDYSDYSDDEEVGSINNNEKTTKKLNKKDIEQQDFSDYSDELLSKNDLEELLKKNIPLTEIRKLYAKDKSGKSKLTPVKRLKKIDELAAVYNPAPPPVPPKTKSKTAIEQENYFKDALDAGITKKEINDLLATGIRRDYIRHFLYTSSELRQKDRMAYKKELEEFKVGRFNPNYKIPEEHFYKDIIKQGITMQQIKELLEKGIDKHYVRAFFANNMKLYKTDKKAFDKKKGQFIKDFTGKKY